MINNNSYLVSTWSKAQADKLCPSYENTTDNGLCSAFSRDDDIDRCTITKGLPTTDHLAAFKGQTENEITAQRGLWPKKLSYITDDNKLFNLSTGNSEDYTDGTLAYVTCVEAC